MHNDEEITVDAVWFRARHAVSRNAQRCPLFDAGRYAHLERLGMFHMPVAVALLAGVIDDHAESVAGRTGDDLLDKDVLFFAAPQYLLAAPAACVAGTR